MDSIRNAMKRIIDKCDVCIDGNVISKELLIKTLSGFISSTIEDKRHNVGIILHTGSICFDAILLAYAAISDVLYNETNAKVFEGAVKGTPAKIHFCDSVQNERERIDSIIDDLAADGYRDIVLLTCKTEATSILSDSVNNGKYRNKYLFTTCRKFKGLEADVVILLDVDKTTFEQGNALIFYVGTSRARIKLEIAAILSDDDCKEILMSILNYRGKIRRAQKDLAGALNAIGSLDS